MGDRGSASVELALLVPVVVVMLGLVVETALVAQTQVWLVHAAREGARAAAVSPEASAAVAAVDASLPAVLSGRVHVAVERPREVGADVVVTLRMAHRVFRAVGGFPIELGWTARMRVEGISRAP
jgi:Flp pilus assembly protein TadG